MRPFLCVAFAALLASGAVAHADPVTYTLTGTFTGTLDGVAFTDDAGSITQVTDTTDTINNGGGFYTNTDGISVITLDGIGTAIFLDPGFGASGSQNTAGFFDIDTGFGLNMYDPCLGQTDCTGAYDPNAADYNLSYPFSDTGILLESFAASSGQTELTSRGELMISGDIGTPATFTATGATPEPSSVALLGTGLLGAVGVARRRLRSLR